MEYNYYEHVKYELSEWEKTIQCEPNFLDKLSKKMQKKIDHYIPDLIHEKIAQALALSIKGLTSGMTVLASDDYIKQANHTLQEKDKQALELIKLYKNIASVEGAATGAGGVMLSAIDFPALIGIKLKFLQELSTIYGYNPKELSERQFMIKLFQFAYSSELNRWQIYEELRDWQNNNYTTQQITTIESATYWRTFATEYRDAIDLRKMLQVVPGLGAIVGAIANRSILDDLAQDGVKIYQLRAIKQLIV